MILLALPIIVEANSPQRVVSSSWDWILGPFKEALEWFGEQILYIIKGVVEAVIGGPLHALGDAYASLALKIPVMVEPSVNGEYIVVFGAIDELFRVCEYAGYMVLGIAGVVSVISMGFEVIGIVREGEAISCLKRILLAAALIPTSKYIYNYVALALSSIAYMIMPPEAIGCYVGLVSTFLVLLVTLGVFTLGAAFVAVLTLVFIMLIAAATRFLLTGVLAGLLPLAIALSVVPINIVRRIGLRLLSILFALLFVPILTAAILFLANGASSLLPSGGLVGAAIALIIWLIGLGAPLISIAIVHEAGVGLAIATGILSYAARPLIQPIATTITKTLKAQPPAITWIQEKAPSAATRIKHVAQRLPVVWYLAHRGVTGVVPKLIRDLRDYRRAPVVLGSPPRMAESFKDYVTSWSKLEKNPNELRKAIDEWIKSKR